MTIIPQTLNINNSRTARAKSINLYTIRKLIEYSLENVRIKAMFTSTVFEILMSEGRSVLSLAKRGTGSESVKSTYQPLLIGKVIKKYLNHKFSSNKNWLKDSSDVYYFKLSYIGNLSHKY